MIPHEGKKRQPVYGIEYYTDLIICRPFSYSVTLNWSPPINRGGVELTGYVIEKRLSTTHKWEKAATVDASVTLYTIENLKEKSEYYFRVSAENEEGAGEPAATEKVALRTSARKYNIVQLCPDVPYIVHNEFE